MRGTAERAYRESHPWITFQLDLTRAGPEFWMMLGEARSKNDHLANSLLKPEVAERMQLLFLAKGVQATTAIEGNTLSEREVLEIVAGREPELPPSQAYLAREVENIVEACNGIATDLLDGGRSALSVEAIREFNRQVLEGLELREGVVAGEIRTQSVVVGQYRGPPWQDCAHLLERLCDWLNGPTFAPPDPAEEWIVPYALMKAVVAHLYLAWIHAFGDGNGRTARLVELQILLAAGVPMPAAHLLSNHYNLTRTEYYRQLQRASDSGGEVVPFLVYALQGFLDGIRDQVDRVWTQLYEDRWEQYIYETFGRISTRAQERRRDLALEISKYDAPVPRRRLIAGSPELSDAYRGTDRMLSRDLNALVDLGLIERSRAGFRARKETILGFRPGRRGELAGSMPTRAT
jgi:Fic family protein